jgi:hypothetical protein
MRTSILKAATISFTAAPSNISDALFRLWGKALSDALVVVGMIRVECTGDIEWTTVTAPASGNTYPGWEVFRLSDAAHATHPIYFKIEYGGGTYKEAPKVRLTVGRGVNVADGTLTAPTTSTLTIGTSGDHDTTALYDCFISGATGRCNVAMFVGMNAGIAFSIERTKDDNGDPTDAAVNVVTWSQLTTTCVQQQLPKTGDAYPATPQGIQCDLPNTRDGTYGRNVGLFFVRPNLGWADNPYLGAAVYFTDNIVGVGAPIALSVLGTTHTYILSGISANVTINGNNTAYKSIAMRYE